jgi:hypothetical protein
MRQAIGSSSRRSALNEHGDGKSVDIRPHRRVGEMPPLAVRHFSCFTWIAHKPEERIMAKGAMKAGKEPRKPKKDAKKPAAAPAPKAPPVKAMRIKEK